MTVTSLGRPGTETHGRNVVRLRSGDRCEVGVPNLCTVEAGAYVGQFSHRRSEKQGGTWDVWNGVRSCSPCHLLWIEKEYELARLAGLRVKSGVIGPRETPVYLRRPWPGWFWLLPDGTYDANDALDAALALGFPEVPEWRRTAWAT